MQKVPISFSHIKQIIQIPDKLLLGPDFDHKLVVIFPGLHFCLLSSAASSLKFRGRDQQKKKRSASMLHFLQTHTVASRHSTVAAVLENVETIGVVNAGSTLQMLQVRFMKLLIMSSKSLLLLHTQRSENNVHKDIWRKISDNPESLVDNYVAGLEMVDVNVNISKVSYIY